MKQFAYVLCSAVTLAFLLVSGADAQSAQSESLGDYARSVKKEKTGTSRQFDNDNLPKTDKLSVVGNAPEAADKSSDKLDSAANPDAKPTADAKPAAEGDQPATNADSTAKKAEDKPSQESDERQKMYDRWKMKFSDQQKKIDLLSRELDVLQREYRLRAAAFYADAGNRLRNQGSWDKEDATYKQQIAEKQKAADNARQELDDLKEQARKAGVPSSMRE